MADRYPVASSERQRLFWAVELPGAAGEAVAAVVRVLRERPDGDAVRWVRAENLHVTLRFLGDVAADRVPVLQESVASQVAPIAPFELALGEAHAFPSARRPRVIALVVQPPEPLEALAAAVERGVQAAGFAPEPRRFRAHLTLGRVRPRESVPDVTGPDTRVAETLHVTEAVLFRSELRPSGARYTPLARAALGA